MKENILNSAFFSVRFVLEWTTEEKKPKKEKEKCVPAGILSELENVNSMLRSETERAKDSTYVQAETEKPNKFPQEEGAHHSIPLIILFFWLEKMCLKQNGFRWWNGTKIVR